MKDRIILMKVESYLKRIQRNYDLIKDLNEKEILNLDESFALTQFITNVHSLIYNISNDGIAEKMIIAVGRGLITCRHISSHDYDSLDWSRVKVLCRKLLSDNTKNVLEDCIKIAEEDEKKNTDYTHVIKSNIIDND